jgi:hypothetical protein
MLITKHGTICKSDTKKTTFVPTKKQNTMKEKPIRTPLRFRTEPERTLYFTLRKQSNKENKSLNTIILNLLKSLKNDKSTS